MSRPLVVIQRNPRSGSGSRRQHLWELVVALRELGFEVRVYSRRARVAAILSDPERRASLKCLVAAGGDGTVADAVNRYPGVPLAVMPMGTENLLARYLGIPRSGRFVAEMIAAGKTRRLDVWQVGARRFTLMAGAGIDADVAHRLDAVRKGNITHWSYVPRILESVSRYEFPELRLFVDDDATPLTGRLAILTNVPAYAMQLPIAAQAVGDDGLLDVRVFEKPSVSQLLRYCYHVVRSSHEALPDVHACRARRVRIESAVPVPVQADGDPAGWTPATVVPADEPLCVLAPESGLSGPQET